MVEMTETDSGKLTRVLGYVGSLMIVGSIMYVIVSWVLAMSTDLKGGVPEGDLEASFVVGIIGVVLLFALAVRGRMKQ